MLYRKVAFPIRKRIFDIIEAANSDDLFSKAYDVFMMLVILTSLVPLAFKVEPPAFVVLDKVCVGIFILDYLLRLATADYKFKSASIGSFLRYPFSFMAIVDLLSILPSLFSFHGGLRALRLMRMARALRVLRIFKAARYSKSLQRIAKVLKTSRESLLAVGTLAIAYILISALIIINVEPESFDNFFEAVYWATISLTTMGYGDIYPVSAMGQMVTMFSSFFGIAIIALPSGIITVGYMNEVRKDIQEDEEREAAERRAAS